MRRVGKWGGRREAVLEMGRERKAVGGGGGEETEKLDYKLEKLASELWRGGRGGRRGEGCKRKREKKIP